MTTSNIFRFERKVQMKFMFRLGFLLILFVFASTHVAAQNRITNANRTLCLPADVQIAFYNYCSTCSYKFGPSGGSLSTVNPTTNPGGTGVFPKANLSAGSYTLTEDGSDIGTLVLTQTTAGTLTLSTDTSPPSGCSGTVIALTAGGADSYSWTKNAGSSFSEDASINVTLETGTTDTYEVTGTFNTCGTNTTQTQSIPVTGYSLVSGATISGGELDLYKGSEDTQYTGTASNKTGHSWSISNADSSSISDSGQVTWDADFVGSATISYTATGSCSSSSSDSVVVTVREPESIQTDDQSVCANELPKAFEIAISNYCSHCTYTYDNNSGGQSTATMTTLPGGAAKFTTTGLSTGTYHVYSDGLQIDGDFIVSEKDAGTASITLSSSAIPPFDCAGTMITLTPGGGINNYTWTKNGTFHADSEGAIDITLAENTQDVYEVTADAEDACGNVFERSQSITVQGYTEVSNASISGGVTDRYKGTGSTPFSGTAVNPDTSIPPSWSITSSSELGSTSISNDGNVTWDAAFVGVATVSYTAYGVCSSESTATKMVNVREPEAILTDDQAVCSNELPKAFEISILHYCEDCVYTYDNNSGGQSTATMATLPGGAAKFTTEALDEGTYHVYSDGEEIQGDFVVTEISEQTPWISIIPTNDDLTADGNGTIHACEEVNLSIDYEGIILTSWQWKKDGSPIGSVDATNIDASETGVYTLDILDYEIDLANCYAGVVEDPTIELEIQEVYELESITAEFNECESSRNITIDQVADGGLLPGDYTVEWYDDLENPLDQVPDWDNLTPGDYSYKILGVRSNGSKTCKSPTFATVTVSIKDLTVSITSPEEGATIATGNTISIVKTETNSYGTINYSLVGAGTTTPITNPSSFMIPEDAVWSDDYQIKASTCSGNFYSATFNVADYDRTSLILPEANASAFRETVEVKWIRHPGHNYKFSYTSVVTDAKVEMTLSAGSLISEGVTYSYLWEVPEDLEGKYVLAIEESSGSYSYTGDITFHEDLQLLSPNQAQVYEIGRPLIVKWEGGDENGTNYVVNLLKGGISQGTLGSIANTNTFIWDVPDHLAEDNDYQIEVQQTLLGVVKTDVSDYFFSLGSCINPDPPTASQHKNYVKTYTAREPEVTCLSGVNNKFDVMESIAYLDGLGRPLQNVIRNSTPEVAGVSYDMIGMVEYDLFGRKPVDHMPFTSMDNDGSYLDMSLTSNSTHKETFHESLFPGQASFAFGEAELEDSPLGRVQQQGAPGSDWQLNGSHTQEFKYLTNEGNEVLSFYIQGDNIYYDYYDPNELYKSVVYDENIGETEGEVIEYKDKLGRVILKRVKIGESAGVKTYAQTYYIYDDYDNLRYVIQPEGVRLMEDTDVPEITLASLNDETFRENWMFVYEYDSRQRMIRKRIPGSDWVKMIYDDRDRLVLTQDGNQKLADFISADVVLDDTQNPLEPYYEVFGGKIRLRDGFQYAASGSDRFRAKASSSISNGRWLFTKYDALNRPVMTGFMQRVAEQEDLVNELRTHYAGGADHGETFSGSGPLFGYSNNSFPTDYNVGESLQEADLLTVTYYDSYDFTGAPVPAGMSTQVKGQVTGTRTRVLDSNTWLTSITYYDDRYRVIMTVTDNLLGGQETVKMTYLNDISPLVVRTERTHTGGQPLTIVEEFTYDHMDRLLTTTHSINGATPELITSNTYNEIGQLIEKNLGGAVNGASPVQSVDYDYNIRGWLTSVNGGSAFDDVDDQFGMQLMYSDAAAGEFRQFNGNIGQIFWKTEGGNGQQTTAEQQFDYKYDAASRMLSADYVGGNNDLSSISYDFNGNIQNLTRNTKDVLTYDYGIGTAMSNQLLAVTDAGDLTLFKDGNTTDADYSYDENGNLTQDLNKEITDIQYNYLNLPQVVTFQNGNTVAYTYDAVGLKLRKTAVSGNNTTTTDYISGVYYINNQLKFVQHSEGRALANYSLTSSGIRWDYEYNLSDHLGNVRATVTSVPTFQVSYAYPMVLVSNQPGEVEMSWEFQGINPGESHYWSDAPAAAQSGNEQVLSSGYDVTVSQPGTYYLIKRTTGSGTVHYANEGNFTVTTTGEEVTVVQRDDYYPFGLAFNSWTSGAENFYKYNGKEEQSLTGWYDYQARFFEPTLGRFLQVDAAADLMKAYNPYHYSFNNPIRFVDKDGNIPGQATNPDPNDLITKDKLIDMNLAPASSAINSAGHKRNGPWFWRQMLKKHPEMFSARNRALIRSGKAPYVDPTWIDFNPSHAAYNKDKLIHHHVDQGRFAAGIPEKGHQEFHKELHPNDPYGKKNPKGQSTRGKGNRAARRLGGVGRALGWLSLGAEFTGSPHSMFKLYGPKKQNTLYYDMENEVYFEKSNYYKTEDGDEYATVTFYEDYDYDKEQGRWVGVGKIESVTYYKARDMNHAMQILNGGG